MNNVVLIGRSTNDMELKFIPGNGTAVGKFTLAVDRDFKNKDGEKETDFLNIEVWGKLAEAMANYINKGKQVAVNGSIRVDKYETEAGEKRTAWKIRANSIELLGSKNVDNVDKTLAEHSPFAQNKTDAVSEFKAVEHQLDSEDIPF